MFHEQHNLSTPTTRNRQECVRVGWMEGLRVIDIAAMAGVSVSYASQLSRGDDCPSRDRADGKFCHSLNTCATRSSFAKVMRDCDSSRPHDSAQWQRDWRRDHAVEGACGGSPNPCHRGDSRYLELVSHHNKGSDACRTWLEFSVVCAKPIHGKRRSSPLTKYRKQRRSFSPKSHPPSPPP